MGLYDPFSDDPRCGVQRISLDPNDGTLAIGGTAGQVIIWDMIEAETELDQSVSEANSAKIFSNVTIVRFLGRDC